jgi:hypothetical protein
MANSEETLHPLIPKKYSKSDNDPYPRKIKTVLEKLSSFRKKSA